MNTQRYSVILPWSLSHSHGSFSVEVADLLDKRTNRSYQDGAQRVVDSHGKPVKGRGGTSPFAGETAWSDVDRLAQDLAFAERYAR